ncbi:hypothetical protein [Bradyrhizobium sp. BR 1433]|uniref:hypothetical protein n=1 Tax=Bradyrhizobium sp. BR 1433 TaxID=3447967 RepID=UPI003EE4A5CE
MRAAAALLRHYLEHFAKVACDRLRASVEFRGDAQFMLGDLLPRATSTLGDLLKKAKVAANSWNQKDVVERITAIETAFGQARTRTGHENWQINTAVHFNEWADLKNKDFSPVVKAFRTFTGAFVCETCDEMLFVALNRGKRKRCDADAERSTSISCKKVAKRSCRRLQSCPRRKSSVYPPSAASRQRRKSTTRANSDLINTWWGRPNTGR